MSRKLVRRTDAILGLGTGPEVSAAELILGHRGDHLRVADIPLAWIETNPDQPRRAFDEPALAALAASIERNGLLQPVVVRTLGSERYGLIAGERRMRAMRLLGRDSVPALIRDARQGADIPVDELALIENVQRVDLNAVELAGALGRLAERHGYSQRDLGRIVGRDAAWVNRLLAIRGLPPGIVDDYLSDPSRVTMSALIEVAAADGPERAALWDAAKGGATVRALKARRKEGGAQTAPVPAQAIARGLGSLRRTVEALRAHRGHLATGHRDELIALKREIDSLLEEP